MYAGMQPRHRVRLQEAARQVVQRKGEIVNVDATLIAQQHKLYPHIGEMKKRLAAALGLAVKQIGVLNSLAFSSGDNGTCVTRPSEPVSDS